MYYAGWIVMTLNASRTLISHEDLILNASRTPISHERDKENGHNSQQCSEPVRWTTDSGDVTLRTAQPIFTFCPTPTNSTCALYGTEGGPGCHAREQTFFPPEGGLVTFKGLLERATEDSLGPTSQFDAHVQSDAQSTKSMQAGTDTHAQTHKSSTFTRGGSSMRLVYKHASCYELREVPLQGRV
jgi:hypothetical protein